MELRVTVRDGQGGVQYDAVTMNVYDTGSTFQVTSHTSSRTYGQGDQTTVSWDVAGTSSSPLSCQSVDIGLITLDGIGVEITTTSNDGSEKITIPSNATALSSARFIVSCSTSRFFSVSSANLTILDTLGTGEDDTSSLGTEDETSSSGGGGSFGYMALLLLPLFMRRAVMRRKFISSLPVK